MFGYRLHRWGTQPDWEEINDPDPAPGDVLIEVEACGVGLTVLNCINGDLAADDDPLPLTPGHELVGRVTAIGEGVDESLLGRQVVAYFYLICGECKPCRTDREPLCERLAGFVGVHRDGGYAPRVVLPARNAIPIADSLDAVSATVVPDAVATSVHVAQRARIGAGDRVGVIGAAGGVGIHMVQVAKHHGAEVVGFDLRAKVNEIERLGALPPSMHRSSPGTGRVGSSQSLSISSGQRKPPRGVSALSDRGDAS